MTEQITQPDTFEVPAQIIVDNLRQEVARLNDERISLLTKLQFSNEVIEVMKAQLQAAAGDAPADDNVLLTGPAE